MEVNASVTGVYLLRYLLDADIIPLDSVAYVSPVFTTRLHTHGNLGIVICVDLIRGYVHIDLLLFNNLDLKTL
jgi:hypothetical protein